MVKLKSLFFHDLANVDPEIIKEMRECAMEVGKIIFPILAEYDPNIAMSAMSWVHACFLNYIISEIPEELTKAGKMAAISLIENIRILEEERQKK